MRAGRMDRRITIEKQEVTQSDSGQEVIAWSTVATVWAEKIENRGAERFAAKQLVGHAVRTFKIRWSTTIAQELNNECRITFDSRTFDITDIRELGRREGIEIDCHAPGEEPLIPGADVDAIAGAIWVDADAFFTSQISTGAVGIVGTLFVDGEAFFTSAVTSPGSIAGSLFSESDAFFTAIVSTSYPATGDLHVDSDFFFSATVAPGAVNVAGSVFTEADAFFAATVSAGGSISASLYEDADAFFSATVTRGAMAITGVLYEDADAFFSSTVSSGGGTAGQAVGLLLTITKAS